MRNKILITGAAGFIGSHLFNKLLSDSNNEVIGIDNFYNSCNNPIISKVKNCDILDKNKIKKYIKWADIIYHLAAQISIDKSIINPQETIDININGTFNILDLVNKYNKKMVFASSSEVYGSAQNNSINEQHPLDAQSTYAATKVFGDRLCRAYYHTYGTKVAILRNFNTFGEYQSDDSYGGVIAKFTKNALNNENLEIYGDGTQERDYMHVEDAIQGYELCIKNKIWGEPINFGTGKTVSINKLSEMIIEITRSKSKIKYVKKRLGEVQKLKADISLAKSYGFKPKTNFRKHLEKYIKSYKFDNIS